jgi:Aromatic-ring-opening dioxygenase LigAB, LigA subunit
MSKYATNRMLWEAAADPKLAQRLRENPDAALAGRELTGAERAALANADVRQLFQLGVHPFLLWNFALQLNGGFTLPFAQSYVDQLKGLTVTDLVT